MVVYESDCHYLLYSIHFSEFMPISFTRKQTKYGNTRSPPFSYDMKMAANTRHCTILVGAQVAEWLARRSLTNVA